tara:strand:- start:41 stop:481 length:441 start_codon:yes stop_codon:yes gene_type:complete
MGFYKELKRILGTLDEHFHHSGRVVVELRVDVKEFRSGKGKRFALGPCRCHSTTMTLLTTGLPNLVLSTNPRMKNVEWTDGWRRFIHLNFILKGRAGKILVICVPFGRLIRECEDTEKLWKKEELIRETIRRTLFKSLQLERISFF